MGPGRLDLGEPVFNGDLPADTVKEVFRGLSILFSMGELDAVVCQDGMDGVRQRFLKMAQELRGLRFPGHVLQFDAGELAGSVHGDPQIKPAFRGMDFSDVDVK
jgi:hypothetical protein